MFLSSKRLCALVLLAGTLLMARPAAHGQTKPAPPIPASEKPIPPASPPENETPAGDYMLGAEDILEISVSHHADLNRQVTILPNGKITLPDIGDFQAGGKTHLQLASDIQTAYAKTLNNAQVTIIVREVRSRKVGITGAVRSSGTFDIKQNWRLMDLIAVANGLSAKPDRIRGRLLRRLKTVTLDVVRANAHPDDTSANVLLEPNDIVLLDDLPPLHNEISVMGQVGRVGAYALDEQTTLLTLITQAGGTNERAALSRAYVQRGSTQLPINLRPALALNRPDDAVVNFKLQAGDILVVPEIENRYAVMGQVSHPSYYPIPEKGPINVFEAFNFAGGQLPSGDLAHAGIIRIVDGKATVIPVNMNNVLKKPETALRLTLQPEDILFVPPKGPRGLGWQDALAPLSLLGLLGMHL